ncbi:MAG: hypothetical protein LCH56_03535 [Proteobacteria bacterium]|nr:hypothetical protein [Pseudomonadota bacterium]
MATTRENALEPLYVTIKTGCRITGLGATKMNELVAARVIDSFKVDGRRLLVYASLKRLCQSSSRTAA